MKLLDLGKKFLMSSALSFLIQSEDYKLLNISSIMFINMVLDYPNMSHLQK